MSLYCKEFPSIYHAFLEYNHILWETTLPTLVMTDNRYVTGFSQIKAIPPTSWNACDYILQFTFRITHVAGTFNTAADFFSRLELTSKEKIELTIPEDIQTLPIQIKMQSNNVAEEEQRFFLPDETSETDKKRYLENNMPKNEPKSQQQSKKPI